MKNRCLADERWQSPQADALRSLFWCLCVCTAVVLNLSAASAVASSDLGSKRLFYSADERAAIDARAGVTISGDEASSTIKRSGQHSQSADAASLPDSQATELRKPSESVHALEPAVSLKPAQPAQPATPATPAKPAKAQSRRQQWIYQGRVDSAAGTRFLINNVVWRPGLMDIRQIDPAPDARSIVVVMSTGQRQTLSVGKPVSRAVRTNPVPDPDASVRTALSSPGVIAHAPGE